MAIEIPSNVRRIGLQVAFWGVLFLLLLTLAANFVNIGQTTQLSAYGDDWNDLSAFREDLNDLGIETHSLVSTPLLLSQIEDPGNTTFVIAGMERDTLSFPQFDEDGFVTEFVEKGQTESGGWINAGLFHLNTELFKQWDGKAFSLERDLFTALVNRRGFRAVTLDTEFTDIGVPEDYQRFCAWVESGRSTKL